MGSVGLAVVEMQLSNSTYEGYCDILPVLLHLATMLSEMKPAALRRLLEIMTWRNVFYKGVFTRR